LGTKTVAVLLLCIGEIGQLINQIGNNVMTATQGLHGDPNQTGNSKHLNKDMHLLEK
jgi:hypothetical protein